MDPHLRCTPSLTLTLIVAGAMGACAAEEDSSPATIGESTPAAPAATATPVSPLAGMDAILASGSELHITHPNGTDVRMQIAGRPIRVTDGAVEPEGGSMGRSVWLPAGEVFLAPVPGSASGRIVAERVPWEGGFVEGLTLEIEAGRVTSMTARSGGERLLAAYEAAGEGKDVLGVVDFGINPDVRLEAGSPGAWIADGFVSLAIGNNAWAGGDNVTGFGQPVHLGGATATVDGRPLLEDGTLVIQ